MAAGASLDSLPEPPVYAGAPVRRSLWARLRTSRFLFIGIIVHVLFGLGAAIYVVQTYTPKPMEILIAKQPGGKFFADLLVEARLSARPRRALA